MATHSTLQGMRVAPRAGHPRVAATLSGGAGRSVSPSGVVYYTNEEDEADDRFKLMDKDAERRDRRAVEGVRRDVGERQKHAKKAQEKKERKGAWEEEEWEEDFGGLASSVRQGQGRQERPQSANPDRARAKAPQRPKSAHGNSGSISGKVQALEDTVNLLQTELADARNLVESTAVKQRSNDNGPAIDSRLAEKLALLRRDQERNVKVIEELVKQRDQAQAKARRLEQVLVKEVDDMGITIDPDVPLHRPTAASTSPKKAVSQRPGESEEEYARRIKRRHEHLVKPFRSMEVHEAVLRRNKIKKEDSDARKAAMLDAVVKAERGRVVQGMDAKEFSFCQTDRERQEKKEAMLETKRREKLADEKALQFKARPVKLYFTENWEDIEKRQDAERKQRVASRAAQLQSQCQLPARMAMHEQLSEQKGHVEKESAAARTKRKLADKEAKEKYVPRVDPDRYTEIMEKKKQAWAAKLKATKEAVHAHATVPNRELPIERRQREYEEKKRERHARDAEKEARKRAQLRETERIAKEKALTAVVAPPKMTKAYRQKVDQIKRKKEEALAREEKEARDDERRRRKEDIVNAEVRQMVAEMERERKAAFPGHFVDADEAAGKAAGARKEKEEEFKERQRKLKDRLREVQKQHKEEGGIIGATEKAILKQKAKRKALSVVANAVGWKGRGGGDELFDDAEKAYLGFQIGDEEYLGA